MHIEREKSTKLLHWKNAADRQPLTIEGARQTGKTWVMLDFGRRNFEHLAYFYFEKDLKLAALFESTKSAERLFFW